MNLSNTRRIRLFILILLATVGFSVKAMAEGDNYHLALQDYFKVSEQQVADAKTTGITDEELPVVFFMAQRNNLGPESVTNVHSSGLNWMQVAYHFRLNPLVFYTYLTFDTSHTPFEKVYGEYKNRQNPFNMTDADLINLANLKFLSEYYGRDPKDIIQRRASGKTFAEINEDYWRNKDDVQWDVNAPAIGENTPTPTFKRQRKGSANGFTAPP